MSSIAVTRQINPPGTEPKLSIEQVWAGLAIKVRDPVSFVAPISACRVELDTPEKVIRHITYTAGPKVIELKEEVYLYEPTMAYFEASNGMRVTNLVSYDSKGELLLTYTFTNGVPGYTTIDDPVAVNEKIGGAGVEHGIQRIRELNADGTIA